MSKIFLNTIAKLQEENAALKKALKPFAEAAEGLEDEPDKMEIWEHPCGMQITAGDLRKASKAI